MFITPDIAGVMVDTFIQQGETSNVFTTLGGPEGAANPATPVGRDSSKEIAAHLEIAASRRWRRSGANHEKLNLYSVAELTKYAVREGLTSCP